MKKQVDSSHYSFSKYVDKARWISVWHQLDEVLRFEPINVLEVGPGGGLFKNAAATFGLSVKTLDLDPELKPDYVGSADSIPFPTDSFDVTCAFQVLEHMPFQVSLKALSELYRVAKKAAIISLPDVETRWPSTLAIPKLGTFRFVLPRPGFRPQSHHFDGEHYWEINKKGYTLSQVTAAIRSLAPEASLRTYRVHENQYHRFFILKKPKS